MSTPEKSPAGLRLVHAVVFLGFASATLAAVHPELIQLWVAWSHDFHPGTPPSVLGVAAGLVAAGGALTLVVFFARGQSAPLWVSGALLGSLLAGLASQGRGAPSRRSPEGANLLLLELGRAVHLKARDRLQQTGEAPTAKLFWDEALTTSMGPERPFHQRWFADVPWKLELLSRAEDFPAAAQPGTLLVFVSEDKATFTITLVGLDEHLAPARLRDRENRPIELKGVFNPDMPQ